MNKHHRGKQLVGEIVSLKTPKTAIVAVTRTVRHPLYKKAVRKTKRIAVHCTIPDLNVGDYVRIVETRPISKTKHFIVVEKAGAL